MSNFKVFMKTIEFSILQILLIPLAAYPIYKSISLSLHIGRTYLHSILTLTDALWIFFGAVFAYGLVLWPYRIIAHMISSAHAASVLLIKEDLDSPHFKRGLLMMFKRIGAVFLLVGADILLKKSIREISHWLAENSGSVPKFLKKGIFHRFLKSSVETLVYSSTECILGYLYFNPDVGVIQGSISGAGVYFKSWKSTIKQALLSTLKVRVFSFLLRAVLVLVGAYLVSWNLKGVIILLISVKVLEIFVNCCLVRPYVMTSMLLAIDYSEEVEDGVIGEIETISESFKKLLVSSEGRQETMSVFVEGIKSLVSK
jgi:hypothetical protein